MNQPVIPFPARRVARRTAERELEILRATYPQATTALDYDSPYALLIAVILSAQTTDVRINSITPQLFARFPTPQALASADLAEVEELIKSSGFFRMKSKNIVSAAKALVERYGGEVPSEREALEALPGVGRKTASVVLAVAFETAAFAVDTHVFRVAHRLGLTRASTPRGVEDDVTKLVAPQDLRHAHHWLILHGRAICKAPIPACERCPLNELCPSAPLVERYRRAKTRSSLKSAAERKKKPAQPARRVAKRRIR
ncbi:MAG: endonuclease III [Candidatus Baltobacteraceae bacterium]